MELATLKRKIFRIEVQSIASALREQEAINCTAFPFSGVVYRRQTLVFFDGKKKTELPFLFDRRAIVEKTERTN